MKDKATTTDAVSAGLVTDVIPPEHPCPKCGKAMVDHRTHEQFMARLDIRICSSEKCRTIADWTSGAPVLTGQVYAPNSN
jgi:hypothetical protein